MHNRTSRCTKVPGITGKRIYSFFSSVKTKNFGSFQKVCSDMLFEHSFNLTKNNSTLKIDNRLYLYRILLKDFLNHSILSWPSEQNFHNPSYFLILEMKFCIFSRNAEPIQFIKIYFSNNRNQKIRRKPK